jgi:hypothetical protein
MASFFGNGPLPNWNEVKQWLGKELKWKLADQWEKADDVEWLDRFLKGLLKHAQAFPKMETKALVRMETLKDTKRVTVTVRIPPDTDLRSLQLFASSDRLKVTGLPDNRTHSVRFPCRVYARSGRATQQDDRIVVRFRRRPADSNEVELFIRS